MLCVALCAARVAAEGPSLVYREADEQVIIRNVVFSYQAAKNGFVSQGGDWVAWDDKAGNWLLIPSSGGKARFDAKGNLLAVQKRRQAPPPAKSGYDPSADLGDSGKKAKIDSEAAWDYLGEKQKAEDASVVPGAGDDGGPPIEADMVGGDIAGKERDRREQWALRPGAHSGDPESSMNTGEVVDPIKQLMDTVDSIQSAVQGVATTIDEVDSFSDQIDNFGDGDYDYTPSSSAQDDDDGTRIEDDFGTGSDDDDDDMMQRSTASPRSLGKPPVAPGAAGMTPAAPSAPSSYGPAGTQNQPPDSKSVGTGNSSSYTPQQQGSP